MIKRKILTITLAISSLVLTTAPMNTTFTNTIGTKTATSLQVREIIDESRFDTAIKISQEGWKEPISGVILVNANSLSDALCVAPLAKAYDSHILLINKDSIPEEV